jgi:hypothetical protein
MPVTELMALLASALWLQIPIVFGGVVHMIAVRDNWLPALRRPVALSLFGANKTWRGMLLMPTLSAVGALLIWWPDHYWQQLGGSSPFAGSSLWLAGAGAGLGYVLAELPNSWIKRRLGIAAGDTPERHRALFLAMDQLDSAIGAALAYLLLPGISLTLALCYVLTFPLVALLVKRLLFLTGLKARPH